MRKLGRCIHDFVAEDDMLHVVAQVLEFFCVSRSCHKFLGHDLVQFFDSEDEPVYRHFSVCEKLCELLLVSTCFSWQFYGLQINDVLNLKSIDLRCIFLVPALAWTFYRVFHGDYWLCLLSNTTIHSFFTYNKVINNGFKRLNIQIQNSTAQI